MQPTLTQGNMIATPTTATTPAQTQAAIGAGWTPTTTLNANDLNTVQPTQPFTPQTGSSAQNALGAHVTPAPVDQEMANRNAANDTLLSLTTGSGAYSEAADTLAQQTAAGIPANQAELDDVTNQIATTSTNYDNQIANAQTAGGEGTTAATANVNNLTRQKNNDLAILDIRKSVLTDNISRMNQTIDLKVKADTEANQNQIDGLKTYIQNIDADPQLKAQMTAQANAQQAKLDEIKTTSAEVLKNAANNKAPASVLDAIGKATQDPNATAASITAAAGRYAVDPKVSSDIALAQSTIAKNLSDIAANSMSPEDVSTFVKSLNVYNGVPFVTTADMTGYTKQQQEAINKAVTNQGGKVLNTKDADAISTIQTAQADMSSFNDFIMTSGSGGTAILPKNWLGQPQQLADVTINKFLQVNNQLGAYNTWKLTVIPVLTALKGVGSGGSGGSSRLFGTISNLLPDDTDTVGTAQSKINNINTLLSNSANTIMGIQPTTAPTQSIPKGTNGSSYGHPGYVSDGNQWVKQ